MPQTERVLPLSWRCLEICHPRDGDVHGLTERLSRYLREHTDAADTASGIANWWLRDAGPPCPLDQITQAMEVLRAEGLVETQVLPDGTVVYRSARREARSR